MIAAFIGKHPVKALVDSGSTLSLISSNIFNKLKQIHVNSKKQDFDFKCSNANICNASNDKMKVIAEVDTEIKIHGLSIPFTFHVIDGLAFDTIIGVNFLNETKSIIDMGTNTL